MKNKIMAFGLSLLVILGFTITGVYGANKTQEFSWGLSALLPNGAPTNTPGYYVYTCQNENVYGAEMKYHYSKCTSYNATPNQSGDVIHAEYVVTVTNLDGTIRGSSDRKYHHGVSANPVKTDIVGGFTYGRYCVTNYSLYHPVAAPGTISGILYFEN